MICDMGAPICGIFLSAVGESALRKADDRMKYWVAGWVGAERLLR